MIHPPQNPDNAYKSKEEISKAGYTQLIDSCIAFDGHYCEVRCNPYTGKLAYMREQEKLK